MIKMIQQVSQMAKMLDTILTKQGRNAKLNAVYETLSDFESTTIQEMQRDFDGGDFSDMDDMSENLLVYQNLKEQILRINNFDKSQLKISASKIMKVYEHYESKYLRELNYRNSEQRKNYIESILVPLSFIHLFFEDESRI